MRKYFLVTSLIVILSCSPDNPYEKPPPAIVNVVTDNYFGIEIEDPYRYMENLEDTTVQAWLRMQADHARNILDNIPGRKELIEKMIELEKRNVSSVSLSAVSENDQYIYLKNTPLDKTAKLYSRDTYDGEETLLFDPGTFGEDTSKTYVISYFYVSQDGSKLAISLMAEGLEIPRLVFMDIETRELFPEVIHRIYNFSWLPGNNLCIYQKLNSDSPSDPSTFLNTKLFIHEIGQDTGKDREVFSAEKYPELGLVPEDFSYPRNYKGCPYIFIIVATSDRRLNVYYTHKDDIHKNTTTWKRLFQPDDDVYSFRVTDKDLYFLSPKNAPNFQIFRTSLEEPDLEQAELLVPEFRDGSISYFTITKDGLYFTLSINGVQKKLNFMSLEEKKIQELNMPIAAGSIFVQSKGFQSDDIWTTITGWTSNHKRYRYSREFDEFIPEDLGETGEFPEFADLVVEERMIESHDGEMVPLSLIYRKGIRMDGKNPVYMYGYGAYGFSLNPEFDPESLLWTLEGGIYAVAHVRGGGELGDKWYRGGLKTTKPNTWKDLIACAEFLVENNYTSKGKIAIYGMSAGGIMIGRAMTERPDLFAVAIPSVGVMNAIRGEETPSGPQNAPEFGTVKDSVECMALLEMDAYHHLEEGTEYPATLITAGMNDTRVIVWQPAKFAARLQALNASGKPILLKINYGAGHGIGDTKMIHYEDIADKLIFAFWQTGHAKFQF